MRILLVRRGSIENIDGISTYILELSEELIKRGHEVYLLSGFTRHKDLKEYLLRTFLVDFLPEFFTIEMKNGSNKAILSPITWTQILHTISIRLKPDIIHANNMTPFYLKNTVPRVITYHGLAALLNRKVKAAYPLFKAYLNLTALNYDRIIVVSEKLKAELNNIFVLPNISNKVSVIPIGIHYKRFKAYGKQLNDRLKAVLHVGTTENKNLFSTLCAIRSLLKRGIGVKLYIAGSWSQYLKDCLSTLSPNECESIEYVGPLTRSSMLYLLGRVRALILPSLYESFSITVLESMCCGTPAIVSQAIPQELIIHGVNGFRVYNPMDYKSLAKYAEMLLQDDELWMKMSLNCLKISERYDIDSIIKRILEVYKAVLYGDA